VWLENTRSFLGHAIPGVVIGLLLAYMALAGAINMWAHELH
jgi:hypothetical protein